MDRAGYGLSDTPASPELWRADPFAVAVDDAWKGSGLAGRLMQALMDVARSRRLQTMEGSVLATNSRMLKFVRQLGFRQERVADDPQTVRVVRTL